jgi:hypothetical protein
MLASAMTLLQRSVSCHRKAAVAAGVDPPITRQSLSGIEVTINGNAARRCSFASASGREQQVARPTLFHYSILMPASAMIGRNFSLSALIIAAVWADRREARFADALGDVGQLQRHTLRQRCIGVMMHLSRAWQGFPHASTG